MNTKRFYIKRFNTKQGIIRIANNPTKPVLLAVLSVAVSISALSPAHATINCAGYLPNSYFEGIDNKPKFAGTLVEQADGSQQLQKLDGSVVMDDLNDAFILMDSYVLAQRQGKYGVVDASGKVIVPFKYDGIQTEPDIGTSFILSVASSDNAIKQGVINRHGEWVYPLADVVIQHAHYDSDYDQDYFLVTENLVQNSVATDNKVLTGLLDDKGYWAVIPQYETIKPLNACTGEPLYLQVGLKDNTALIDQNNDVIILFAANQHIESFNNNVSPLLFLNSHLSDNAIDGAATYMSEDIQDDIISAQIIDANGRLIRVSDSPIRKLLYHQFYTFKQAGKIGLINDKGDVVLAPQFDSYRDDADEVWVEKEGEMLRLDHFINLE